jgi:hypothetical protein
LQCASGANYINEVVADLKHGLEMIFPNIEFEIVEADGIPFVRSVLAPSAPWTIFEFAILKSRTLNYGIEIPAEVQLYSRSTQFIHMNKHVKWDFEDKGWVKGKSKNAAHGDSAVWCMQLDSALLRFPQQLPHIVEHDEPTSMVMVNRQAQGDDLFDSLTVAINEFERFILTTMLAGRFTWEYLTDSGADPRLTTVTTAFGPPTCGGNRTWSNEQADEDSE